MIHSAPIILLLDLISAHYLKSLICELTLATLEHPTKHESLASKSNSFFKLFPMYIFLFEIEFPAPRREIVPLLDFIGI